MKLRWEYDETGGYDCITPAFVIYDEKTGKKQFMVDMADHGCLGNDALCNPLKTEAIRAECQALAEDICNKYNNVPNNSEFIRKLLGMVTALKRQLSSVMLVYTENQLGRIESEAVIGEADKLLEEAKRLKI